MTTWEAMQPFLPVLLVPAFWALIEVRMGDKFARRDHVFRPDGKEKFATVDDLNGIGQKAEGVLSVAVSAREIADECRASQRQLESDQRNQSQRFSEVMVEPMRQIVVQLGHISECQGEQGQTLARQGEALKGLAKSLDDLRDQVRGGHRS